MNLYGSDMDESQSPLTSRLTWTVAFEPARAISLGALHLKINNLRVVFPNSPGLLPEGKGILQGHQKLFDGEREVGETTSGGFSPRSSVDRYGAGRTMRAIG